MDGFYEVILLVNMLEKKFQIILFYFFGSSVMGYHKMVQITEVDCCS